MRLEPEEEEERGASRRRRMSEEGEGEELKSKRAADMMSKMKHKTFVCDTCV